MGLGPPKALLEEGQRGAEGRNRDGVVLGLLQEH